MKKLFLLFFVLTLFVNLQAQAANHIKHSSYSNKDAVIGAGIIYVTFITVEANGRYMSKNQIAFTAMSGMAISAGYSLYKTTRFGKKIQHKIYLRRRK